MYMLLCMLGAVHERHRVCWATPEGASFTEPALEASCAPAPRRHPAAQVRTVPVQARGVPLSELRVRAPRLEELSSVEASLRLDAVASAGFRVSRSKMMDLIKSGGWGREGPAAHAPCLHPVGTSSPRPPRAPTMCEKGLLRLGFPDVHHERSRVFQANCW